MKQNMFGDTIIDSLDDDLGIHVDTDDAYALIHESDEDGKHYFEILDNESGEERGHSDAIFESVDDAKKYLSGWFSHSDIQKSF